MRREVRTSRTIVVAAACIAFVVAVLAAWSAPEAVAVGGYVQTQTGPLSPLDQDFLAKVKQAGLWEMPVGADLAERASSPKVREIAGKINAEHHELDHLVGVAAATVGVALPGAASVEQQDWVQRVADDAAPDRQGVFLLRRAHGIILPAISTVRVSTRNETVRAFAEVADTFVSRHIDYLESTGLVNYAELPEAPAPQANPSIFKSSYYAVVDRPTLSLAVLALIAALVIGARAYLRGPRRVPRAPSQPRHGLRRA